MSKLPEPKATAKVDPKPAQTVKKIKLIEGTNVDQFERAYERWMKEKPRQVQSEQFQHTSGNYAVCVFYDEVEA